MTDEINGKPENKECDGPSAPAGFLARWVGKLPDKMFPETNAHSARTCALIGLGVGGFALLFSLIPCLGMYAILFALPGLYVSMLAIRRAPAEDGGAQSKASIGTILSALAFVVALFWLAGAVGAASELDQMERDFDKASRDFERDMDNAERDFERAMDSFSF